MESPMDEQQQQVSSAIRQQTIRDGRRETTVPSIDKTKDALENTGGEEALQDIDLVVVVEDDPMKRQQASPTNDVQPQYDSDDDTTMPSKPTVTAAAPPKERARGRVMGGVLGSSRSNATDGSMVPVSSGEDSTEAASESETTGDDPTGAVTTVRKPKKASRRTSYTNAYWPDEQRAELGRKEISDMKSVELLDVPPLRPPDAPPSAPVDATRSSRDRYKGPSKFYYTKETKKQKKRGSGAAPRIPPALQAVFTAASKGEEVTQAPEEAVKDFGARSQKEEEEETTTVVVRRRRRRTSPDQLREGEVVITSASQIDPNADIDAIIQAGPRLRRRRPKKKLCPTLQLMAALMARMSPSQPLSLSQHGHRQEAKVHRTFCCPTIQHCLDRTQNLCFLRQRHVARRGSKGIEEEGQIVAANDNACRQTWLDFIECCASFWGVSFMIHPLREEQRGRGQGSSCLKRFAQRQKSAAVSTASKLQRTHSLAKMQQQNGVAAAKIQQQKLSVAAKIQQQQQAVAAKIQQQQSLQQQPIAAPA